MKQAATHLTTALWVVLWTAVFLAASFVFAATPRPVLVHPVDQEVLPMDIPHFEWQPCFETRPDAGECGTVVLTRNGQAGSSSARSMGCIARRTAGRRSRPSPTRSPFVPLGGTHRWCTTHPILSDFCSLISFIIVEHIWDSIRGGFTRSNMHPTE